MAVIKETHVDTSSQVDFLQTKCDLDERVTKQDKPASELHGKKIDLGMNMDSKKLFVGGLSWETTENLMKEYFSQFGVVRTCTIKIDKATGHSRGFGFVIFDRESDLDVVLAHPEHRLCNKRIDPKRAQPSQEPARKVFVGGLDPEFSESDIKEYFLQFGKILAIDLPFDYSRRRRKAFIFVTYAADSDARKAAQKEKQMIGGKLCDVRIVQPKPRSQQPQQLQQQRRQQLQHFQQSSQHPHLSMLNAGQAFAIDNYQSAANYDYGNSVSGYDQPLPAYHQYYPESDYISSHQQHLDYYHTYHQQQQQQQQQLTIDYATSSWARESEIKGVQSTTVSPMLDDQHTSSMTSSTPAITSPTMTSPVTSSIQELIDRSQMRSPVQFYAPGETNYSKSKITQRSRHQRRSQHQAGRRQSAMFWQQQQQQ